MKKTMHKLLSLLLAVIMVVGLLPLSAITALAEAGDQLINTVTISGVTAPVVGNSPSSGMAVPENSGYSHDFYVPNSKYDSPYGDDGPWEGAIWYESNNEVTDLTEVVTCDSNGAYLNHRSVSGATTNAFNGTFKLRKYYTVAINIAPKAGYNFDLSSLEATINGKSANVSTIQRTISKSTYYDNNWYDFENMITVWYCFEAADFINKVTITGVTAPVAGNTPSSGITVPANSSYSHNFYVPDSDYDSPYGDDGPWEGAIWYESDKRITDLTEVVTRDSNGIYLNHRSVTGVPTNAFEGIFQSGKYYTAAINIAPKADSKFNLDSLEATINGKAANVSTISQAIAKSTYYNYNGSWYDFENMITVWYCFEAADFINKVTITGVTAPVAGNTPSSGMSVPANSSYSHDFYVPASDYDSPYGDDGPWEGAIWYESDKRITDLTEVVTRDSNGTYLNHRSVSGAPTNAFEGKFQSGKYYTVAVNIAPKADSEFDLDSLESTINGEAANVSILSRTLTNLTYPGDWHDFENMITVWYCFEPAAYINKVAVTGVAAPVAGNSASDAMTVPNNSSYSHDFYVPSSDYDSPYGDDGPWEGAIWYESDTEITDLKQVVSRDSRGIYLNHRSVSGAPTNAFVGKFQSGKYYTVAINIAPKTGCKFDLGSLEATINGEAANVSTISQAIAKSTYYNYDGSWYDFENMITVWYCFEPAAYINKVAVTGVVAPVVGNSVSDAMTVPKNSSYSHDFYVPNSQYDSPYGADGPWEGAIWYESDTEITDLKQVVSRDSMGAYLNHRSVSGAATNAYEGTFKAEKYYTVAINIAPSSGWKFNLDSLEATINGKAANVSLISRTMAQSVYPGDWHDFENMITVWYCFKPTAFLHSVTVTGGYAVNEDGQTAREAFFGDKLSVTAEIPEGYKFIKWETATGSAAVSFANAAESNTTFTMPNGDVKIAAKCAKLYNVEVEGGSVSTQKAAAGDKVYVSIGTLPDGYIFDSWVTAAGSAAVSFEDATQSNTVFTMPESNVKIVAVLGLKSVFIRGLELPRWGEMPVTDVSKVSVGNNKGTTIFDTITPQSVEWFKSDGTKLTDAFDYGKEYTVRMNFKLNAGNYLVTVETLIPLLELPANTETGLTYAEAEVTEYTDNASSLTVECTLIAQGKMPRLKVEVENYPGEGEANPEVMNGYTISPSHTFEVENVGTLTAENFTVTPTGQTANYFDLTFVDNGQDLKPDEKTSFTVSLKSGLTNLKENTLLIASYKLSTGEIVTYTVYVRGKCNVTVDKGSLGTGANVEEGMWPAWTPKAIYAGTNNGYTFWYWKVTGVEGTDALWSFGDLGRTSAQTTLTVLQGDIHLEAVWYKPPTYEPGQVSCEIEHVFYYYDDTVFPNRVVNVITETRTGTSGTAFTIDDLSGEGYWVHPSYLSAVFDSTEKITVPYYPNEYTLTWDLGSTEATAPYFSNGKRTEQVLYGHMIQGYSYTTKWRGHTFMGWDPKPTTMPANDLTITAIWKDAPKYSLIVNSGTAQYYVGPAKYADVTDAKAFKGDGIYLTPNEPAPGYKFVRWAVNNGIDNAALQIDDSSKRTYFAMPDNPVELTAVYEEIQYVNVKVINGEASDGKYGGVSGSDLRAETGTTLYLYYNDASEGYEFDKWLVTKGSANIAYVHFEGWMCEVPDSDVEITALYKRVGAEDSTAHSVTVTGGTASSTSAFFGDKVMITADTPPTGQRFKNWTVNSGGVTISDSHNSTTSFIMLDEDASVTANFEEVPKYSLTTQVSGGHGTISADMTDILDGTLITVIFTPDEGYEIDTVTVNGEVKAVYGSSLDICIYGDTTVIVTYKKIPAHVCTPAGTWTSDENGHWHECTDSDCPYIQNADKPDYAPHTGGEATCIDKAVCHICGHEYGEEDSTNHASGEFEYTDNKYNHSHRKTYKCCGAEAAAKEAHSYGMDNVCDYCGHKKYGITNFGGGTKPFVPQGSSPWFRSDADYSSFSGVWVDDEELTEDVDYTAEEGSILITLLPGFTSTLSEGEHTITIVSTDGSASEIFTVTKGEDGQEYVEVELFKGKTVTATQNGLSAALKASDIDIEDDAIVSVTVKACKKTSNPWWDIFGWFGKVSCKTTYDNTITFKGLKAGTTIVKVGEINYKVTVTEPHVHEYTSEITEPTCTEKGYTIYTCDCGKTYKGDYADALGHDYGEDGKCTRCGEEKPEAPETFAPKCFSASISKSSVAVGKPATITVKTSTDVAYVMIGDVKVDTYKTTTSGWFFSKTTYRVFTLNVSEDSAGNYSYEIYAYNADNAHSEDSETLNLTVKEASSGFWWWM